jgi:hypothetical protein
MIVLFRSRDLPASGVVETESRWKLRICSRWGLAVPLLLG